MCSDKISSLQAALFREFMIGIKLLKFILVKSFPVPAMFWSIGPKPTLIFENFLETSFYIKDYLKVYY